MIVCLGTTPTAQRTMTFGRVELDAVNRAESVLVTASGKSVNVARVLHALGEACTAIGFVGGRAGAFIRADLDAAGVAHDFVEVGPETRTCVTMIDRQAGTATELVQESSAVEAEAFERLVGKLEALLPRARALVLSGSLTPGAPQHFYRDCTERASAVGVPVVLDASGEPLRRALPARPLVVKPNRGELAKTTGHDVSSDEALFRAVRELVLAGPTWAVVTLGAEGLVVSDGQRVWRVRAPGVPVISPIGSGDALAAGLVAGIVRGMPVPEACALGVACGAANAMTAVSGAVRRADVDRLAPQVRPESV